MKRYMTLSLVPCVLVGYCLAAPPATIKKPVTDTYHGVEVVEDYRWLEDWSDAEAKKWSVTQNEYARAYFDKLPSRKALRDRVDDILSAKTVSYSGLIYRGGKLFAKKKQPPKQQPFLVVMPSADEQDKERVVLDPNVLDSEGGVSMDWYVPSFDGSLVAVSMSRGGSESGDVLIFETATGQRVHEIIPRVNGGTAGGDLAWAPDGSGIYYTRYPRGEERPTEDRDFFQQLYYHELGTRTEKDRYELGKRLPRIAEIQLEMNPRTGELIATVQKGDGGEFAHYLRTTDGKWTRFTRFGDHHVQASFGADDLIYQVIRLLAPRGQLQRLPRGVTDSKLANALIMEGRDSIVTDFWGPATVVPTENRVYLEYQLGGPSEIRALDVVGNNMPAPDQKPVSSVGPMLPLGGDRILFGMQSYVDAPAWYEYDGKTNKTRRTKLGSDWPVDLGDLEVVREFATSKDGTRVPVNIIMRKGTKLDGSNPCVVTGYGGYGVNITPRTLKEHRVLFDHGFIYAVANLRGGSEFGENWHKQGMLTNKQNVFDDFTAVVKHMIARKYTSSGKLAIRGGSNGGLLMGAVMTQHPDLMRAVVSYVGIYDMLRVELSANGAFNIPEFGTVENPKQFAALYAYSPYHRVKNGTAYPATLFLTGENDPRVDPMQSRKMTARLQAANSSDAPILLRTSSGSGHGLDTALSERIEETADVFAFLFDQLGVTYRETKEKRNAAAR